MRSRRDRLAAVLALVLAGCLRQVGTVVVRQPPPPAPMPVVIEPLEVDVTRPHNGKIYVQTNRAAYVAIVEIVPERGATLVYPVSSRQRQFVVPGLRDVPVWWERDARDVSRRRDVVALESNAVHLRARVG